MKGISFALAPARASDPATIADELRSMFAAGLEGRWPALTQKSLALRLRVKNWEDPRKRAKGGERGTGLENSVETDRKTRLKVSNRPL
jgi:hypothetical protein